MILGTPTVLNLIPSGARPVVHVNEVDKGAQVQFAIYNGNTAYNVPQGVTATIRGTKGDGFGYTAAAATTVGSNIVTVTLTEQMTAVAGVNNIFELVLASPNGFRVGTSNFVLDVERAALNENTVISDSDIAYAEQVLNDLQSVQAVNTQVQQNKAGLAAEISRATAAEAAEATARQTADNTLQSNINTEASTRAAADSLLQSEIDQLVAPSGSAPSAAEIENARIGADGVTYPTLGDAIRTQDSNLKSHLDAIESYEYEYKNLFSWDERVTGILLDLSTGKNITSASAITSKFIPVKPNTLYTALRNNGGYEYTDDDQLAGIRQITYTQVQSSTAYTFVTSATTQFIRIRINAVDESNGFYLVEGGVNFSPQTIQKWHKTLIDDTTMFIPHVVDALNDVKGLPVGNYYNKDAGTDTSGKYIRATDGMVIAGNGTSVTDYIPIEPGKTYNIGGFYIINDQFAFYDQNKGLLYDPHVKTTTSNNHGTITAPATARYIRLTFLDASTDKYISQIYDEYKPYGLAILSPDDAVTLPCMSMFQTMGVLGDSFASGYMGVIAVDKYAQSWPQVMARANGMTAVNYSANGRTAKSCVSASTRGLSAVLADDPKDLYVIAFGLNDAFTYSQDSTYLGSVSDMSDENYDSNPETFYGSMGRIIRNIQVHAPNAKIILSTTPYGQYDGHVGRLNRSEDRAINDAIVAIAEHYSLPVVIALSHKLFYSNTYKTNVATYGAHPTATMYSAMARAYEELFGKAMLQYESYFADFYGSN